MVELKFHDIINASRGKASRGLFVLSNDGVNWMPRVANVDKQVYVNKEHVGRVIWSLCGGTAILHIYQNGNENSENGSAYLRFDGFKRRDAEAINDIVKNGFGKSLEVEELASSALNVGNVEVDQDRSSLRFDYDEKTFLEIPLEKVSQCVAPGKGDIELHFNEDDTLAREDEILVEMKFRVAPGEDGGDVSESLQQKLASASGIERVTGNVICTLSEEIGHFMAPRGRFEVKMYEDYFRLKGKTYEYKILHKNVNRMFLLPKEDSSQYYFDILLDDPIQLGQQRHRHLVMQLETHNEKIELNLSKKDLEEKYEDKLDLVMSGSLPDTVALLFKVLTGKKVFVTGTFKGNYDAVAVKCMVKSNNGLFYPMTRNLLYLHKPATLIRYQDIDYVEFHRVHGSQGSASRNFDLEVSIRPVGNETKEKIVFQSIDKAEYKLLFAFLNGKVNVRNAKRIDEEDDEENVKGKVDLNISGESESDDDDFKSEDEESSNSDSDSDESLVSDDGIPSTGKKVRENDSESSSDESEGEEKKDGGVKKIASSKTKNKIKLPKRDPKAPKLATTAYTYFLLSRRDEIKASNSQISFGDLSRQIASEWKNLDDSKKEEFSDKSAKDKVRYDKDMESYLPSDGYNKDGQLITEKSAIKHKKRMENDRRKSEKLVPKRDPEAPAAPQSAFFHFNRERREEIRNQEADGSIPKVSFGELAKQLGTEWREIDETAKNKFNILASEDKSRYEKEIELYSPPDGYDKRGHRINESKERKGKVKSLKKEKTEVTKKRKKNPNAPKPPVTAYQLFSNSRREDLKAKNKDASFGELSKLVGAEWKELDDSGKREFLEEASKDKERYKKEMDNFSSNEKQVTKQIVKEELSDDSSDESDASVSSSGIGSPPPAKKTNV